MVKKVFALASVTALSGLMISAVAAGCSSTVTVDPGDTGATAETSVKDTSRPDTSEPDTSVPKCVLTGPFDTSGVVYKTPAKSIVGACTQADYTAIETFIGGKMLTTSYDQLEPILSATCKACAFTDQSAAGWGPFVQNVDDGAGGKVTITNDGACVGQVSGSDAAGKAWAQFEDCRAQACNKCMDSASFSDCNSNDAPDQCQTQLMAFTTAAGNATAAQAILNKCDDAVKNATIKYQLEVGIYTQCTVDPGTVGDAGVDSGADTGL